MSFAVAVYATHNNWRNDAIEAPGERLKAQLEKSRPDHRALAAERERLKGRAGQEQLAARNQLAKLETVRDELITKRKELQTERDALFDKDQKAVAALDTTQANLDKLTTEVEVLRKDIRVAQEDRDKQFAAVVDVTDKIHQSRRRI